MPNYSLFGEFYIVGGNLAKRKNDEKFYKIGTEFTISIIHQTLVRLKVSFNLENNRFWF